MNDRPKYTIAQAHARLTASGGTFETAQAVVRGVPMAVWKNAPATARALFALGAAHGKREFLVYQNERIGYDAFRRAASFVAHALLARGLNKGDRVALAMKNLPEWPVIFLGAVLAGAIVVPLNAWGTADELRFALADSGARFVFADAERQTRFSQLPPCVEEVFGVRTGNGDLIGPSAGWGALADRGAPDIALAPEDDATIFYTSGTTAEPRGVLGTHRSLTTNVFAAGFVAARNALRFDAPPPTSPRITLLAVPLFHVVGSLSVLLPAFAAGGKIILMPKFDADDALSLIARERVTVTGGVPAVALALLENATGRDLSSLELITYGAAPPPADLAARLAATGIAPGQGWGMTETSATCTTHNGADYVAHPHSCGPVLPVGQLKVMRGGIEQPPGAVGELWAFGPNIAKGYWNRADETAEHFRHGWLKTGDLASLDQDGFCTIHDRARDMVIRGGENIYCIEVENILTRHPAVVDAALVGLPHPVLGEVPAALVVARQPVSEQVLRDHARAHLAAFKVPVRVLIQSAPLARNAGGKLIKDELRKAFVS